MKKIVSIENKNNYYIVTIRYSRGWLGRLFFGEKAKETTYVSISNNLNLNTGIIFSHCLYSFTDSEGVESNYSDTVLINKEIRNRVREELYNRIKLENKEKYNFIMSKTENKS